MFDPETAKLLRSAPGLPGLDPQDIPQLLTRHYAQLVSMRLKGIGEKIDEDQFENEWPLDRIADCYELITSVHSDRTVRRASAFVAGTAQQILSRKQRTPNDVDVVQNIDRNRVDPTIAAALLFLAAEQYADANEAAAGIIPNREGQLYQATILSEHVLNLAKGRLNLIIDRSKNWRNNNEKVDDLETVALIALLESLITGIEMLTAKILAMPLPDSIDTNFKDARHAFTTVLSLSLNKSSQTIDDFDGGFSISYSGPQHMASLLIAAHDGIHEAATTNIPSPPGSDNGFWQRWIAYRAKKFPFVWPNHRKAIEQGFHESGKSAVLVLPTGAGKTTVSSLKIAGVLAQGKKVIFLAPTHALVEQLTNDLQEMFPKDILGSVVSSDFDLLIQLEDKLPEIKVMTPERCLAMLSFSPDSLDEVGLLVFDECHLLSPQSGKIRRALDGMLCLLAFTKISPNADSLFLSAMLKNGDEFAQWIQELTGRECISIDLLWKPSRQARGVVLFDQRELSQIKTNALAVQLALNKQKGKVAKNLRQKAQNQLLAHPLAIWGLQHNWLGNNKAIYCLTNITDNAVPLTGDINSRGIIVKPNVNKVSAKLAAISAKHRMKTIVFANQKSHAVSIAREVAAEIGEPVIATSMEQSYWEALKDELGDLKHSILDGPSSAVPHNASMLRLERELAERMFRRSDGATVIVATPTLAQGLNLPAQLAILAGDKRASLENDGAGRDSLEQHEILNAAARAGRAGHLANGIVLLVPEPILHIQPNKDPNNAVIQKLMSVLPEDDRCVAISDPLEVVLDRISNGDLLDRDVKYMINRMTTLNDTGTNDSLETLFNFDRSFAAFAAVQKSKESEFYSKLNILKGILDIEEKINTDKSFAILASQSGLPIEIIAKLKTKLDAGLGDLPITIEGWIEWAIEWLQGDNEARLAIFFDVQKSILAATGNKKDGELGADTISALLPGLKGWINGKPLCDIELGLNGNPDSDKDTLKICPRARELVCTVIPRGFSFVLGLITRVIDEVNAYEFQPELPVEVVQNLSAAVRLGFDSPEKVLFSINNPNILSRVQMHRAYALNQSDLL